MSWFTTRKQSDQVGIKRKLNKVRKKIHNSQKSAGQSMVRKRIENRHYEAKENPNGGHPNK